MQARDHLRALAVLVIGLFMAVGAAPGLDMLPDDAYATTASQEALRAQVPQPWMADAAILAADWNRRLRVPLLHLMMPIERTFRVRQNWSLYQNGPRTRMRLEIEVDGVLWYRSVDSSHAWHDSTWSHRRVRPVVNTLVTTARSKHGDGFVALVVHRVLQERPEAREVRLYAARDTWQGGEVTRTLRAVSRAPEWHVERQ